MGEFELVDAGDIERLSGVRGLSELSDKLCRSSLEDALWYLLSSGRKRFVAEEEEDIL